MGYASTQINLPDVLGHRVKVAGLSLMPRLELETIPHVTVLYGLESDDPEPVREIARGIPGFEVRIGHVGCFEGVEGGTADAVFLHAQGVGLEVLRQRLEQLPRLDQQRAYVPHITLAYVPLGTGKQWEGRNLPVTGERFIAREFIFSERKKANGTYAMHEIPLRSYTGDPGNPMIQAYMAGVLAQDTRY